LEKESYYQEAVRIASLIHKMRTEAGELLSRKVVENLIFLDMPKVRFQVDICPEMTSNHEYKLSYNGYDVVEFMISANSGEEMHSLSKVASGGELARMMLALKCVENQDNSSTPMIFDEIDTGVSGKTARKIGLKLLELSKHTQILGVTHSAQIASLADLHYLIAKREEAGRTITTVTELDEEGRISELSRVLGGISVTDAQRQAAIDMLSEKINQLKV
jgi:DNA repair protein RecN (Recombination protein N)